MTDPFDVDVHDAEAMAEIAMLADLIVATSEHSGRLPQERIDAILGVTPAAAEQLDDGRVEGDSIAIPANPPTSPGQAAAPAPAERSNGSDPDASATASD